MTTQGSRYSNCVYTHEEVHQTGSGRPFLLAIYCSISSIHLILFSSCCCLSLPSFPSCYGARCSSVVTAFAHGAMGRRMNPSWVNPLSYFSFKPVLHDWCNKGRGVCYPVCGMVHIKEPLLFIGKSRP